ncbi:MAG: TIGR02147 family protein [Bdellovibrionales bacterium]|nr:TIGR02147 family protein [Bdellovibrionales bacterium]
MADKTLYNFDDYREYLRFRLGQEGARSGLRAKLAQALNCQSSFVSQVVHGRVHLSLEQAYRANDFFSHDAHQAHFFMLLVQMERAGSRDLRDYYGRQIESLLAEREKIKSRVVTTQELTESQQAHYYSHWDYIGVHMALAVPELSSPGAIAQALKLPQARVDSVLEFLVGLGLAEVKGGRYQIGKVHMHLGTGSPFLHQHHVNWRLEALKRLNTTSNHQLHYSAAFTLSRQDYTKLRENLLQVIEKNLAVVRPSPEQIVVCQMIDLIPLSE